MKKLVFLFVCLFALQTVACADDDKPIQVSQMPQVAQQFINQYFSGQKIALSKMESKFFDKTYEVIFTNGNKVEFDKRGEWREVDCKHGVVPVAIVPAAIVNYVKTSYPDAQILKIDRGPKDYEVKLSNRMELKFDKRFNLIDMDD